MFVNHTDEKLFDDFSSDFKNSAIALGLKQDKLIHIYTIEQYLLLEDVPDVDFSNYDTFAYAASKRDTATSPQEFYAIVYSPDNTRALSFIDTEFYAAIAHEVGHIINFSNPTIPNNGWYAEIKADEIACNLVQSSDLITVLSKLQHQNGLSELQIKEISLRINYINRIKA